MKTLLICCLWVGIFVGDSFGGIKEAEGKLAGRDFAGALEALGDEDGDYGSYLRGVALSLAGKHGEAVVVCDALLAGFPESEWGHKVRFLKARALIEQGKHQEAELVFSAEARRLFSAERKEDIANVLVQYGDAFAREPKPEELAALPADFNKAMALYQQALALEVGREFKDGVRFKLGQMHGKLGNYPGAIESYRAYLLDYDPNWTGPVGSPERFRGTKREVPVEAGKFIWEVRLELVRAQLLAGQRNEAKQDAEDLIAAADGGEVKVTDEIRGDAAWELVRAVDNEDVGQQVRVLRAFLVKHPGHKEAPNASRAIAVAFQGGGRIDEAIAAYEDFMAGKNYEMPKGEAATVIGTDGASALERVDLWKREVFYVIGDLRFKQGNYEAAIGQWKEYIAKFPDGAQWALCQSGIINAEFQVGIDGVAAGNYEEARKGFEVFLKKYPLDDRSRQILFILGQIHFAEGKKAEEAKAGAGKGEFQKAMAAWERLVGKYPGTEEASLALYRVGRLQVEEFGELEKGLATYRKLTFGSWAAPAGQQVALLTEKQLSAKTERVFRTNEEAVVLVKARNVKKVSVSQYVLSLEDYFRKTHRIDGIDELDVDLIEPDKTWEVELEGYQDYLGMEKAVAIPFPNGKAGVCIVKVGDGEREATTLVVRSDIDVVLKSSRREVLVYAENRLAGKPEGGADVLVSDGHTVFAVGKTGEDGVFRGMYPELEGAVDVRVFVSGKSGVASNLIITESLGMSVGLTPKGYLYTAKPAYRPGEVVRYRAILRNVRDGSYAVPEERKYTVRVTDPSGRLIKEEGREIDAFGVMHGEVELPAFGELGAYTVHVSKEGSGACQYAVNFQVDRFALPKIKVGIAFDKRVYFRGETVEATLSAEYIWGSPAAFEPITYNLPDGRSFTEKADADGKLVVTLDTTGFAEGQPMAFQATVPSANVTVQDVVVLARLGFGIGTKLAEDVVLVGDAAELTVTTTAADGKPMGQDLVVKVMRKRVAKADPVLSEVPWVSHAGATEAEETVAEYPLVTDGEKGEGILRIPLEVGGQFLFRIIGKDRFDQEVTAEVGVVASGDEDDHKLRLFAEKWTYDVGETVKVRMHSRLDGGLALVTQESEEIIGYSVVELKKGWNEVEIPLGHGHFPNFRVAAVTMSGRKIHWSYRDFKVRRELTLTLTPSKEVAEPGEEISIAVTAADQLGRPVEAELSLSLVNGALLAAYPDGVTPIVRYFEEGVHRHTEFALGASVGFEYEGVTRIISKAVAEEGERLVRVEHEEKRLEQVRQVELSLLGAQVQEETLSVNGAMFANRFNGFSNSSGEVAGGQSMQQTAGIDLQDGNLSEAGRLIELEPGDGGLQAGMPAPRGDSDLASVWIPNVVTGKDGKASVKLTMPENSAAWRLVGRGVTVETLVGEAGADLVTREELFVELTVPPVLQEGDSVRVMGTVHNMTDFEGEAELVLKVEGGEAPFVSKKRVALKGKGAVQVVFEGFVVPFSDALTVTGSVAAGERSDAVERVVAVRAWGLEFADYAGGITGTEAGVTVELPKGQEYSGRLMLFSVSPSIETAIVEMALGGSPEVALLGRGRNAVVVPHREAASSALLAAVSALEYAKKRKAEDAVVFALTERVKSLVSGMVVTQREDGGWAWDGTNKTSDWSITCTAYWGMAMAKAAGVPTNADTLDKARTYLNGVFPGLGAQDNEAKAILQHALSVDGSADFSAVNRIYRERHALNEITLAYTAATLIRLGREEFAKEVLAVLESKAKKIEGEGGGDVWATGSSREMLREGREVSAVALWCYAKLSPDAAVAKRAAATLLGQYGCTCFPSSQALGVVVHGLAGFYGDGVSAGEDLKVKVFVNDELEVTLTGDEIRKTRLFSVPLEKILAGENTVRFEVSGKGEIRYGATLKGFSTEMKDPGSFAYPYPNGRYYYHDRLSYRNVPLGSLNSTAVKNVEIGQRFRVESMTNHGGKNNEYLVFEEAIPAGCLVVDGSVAGNFQRLEVGDGMLRAWYGPGESINTLSYELVGHVPGEYRVLPPVLRDAANHARMRVGKVGSIVVLDPGEKSEDHYQMNLSEHNELAQKLFGDGRYDEAEKHLDVLFADQNFRKGYEKDLARMLLWIYTSREEIDGTKVVQMFEILRERHPELLIPFDKILRVGDAYRMIGEFERAWLVFSATIGSSFWSDSNISAVLEDQGEYFGSVDYLTRLWWEYPDSADVVESFFAVAQSLYQKAPEAEALEAGRLGSRPTVEEKKGESKKRDKVGMLGESLERLRRFLVLYPNDPMADDAAFALVNVYFDLKQYGPVVDQAGAFVELYAESAFRSSFEYMVALGEFWQRKYAEALKAARPVADGESKDRDYARYIIAQIFHAQGKAGEAIDWYRKVKEVYPDAGQAIGYFERKAIQLEEVTTFAPGDKVEMDLTYRNVESAHLQVYRVDLMKLYLREKNLTNITEVHLAGISPEVEVDVELGDGKDYRDLDKKIVLPVEKEGAYLVICRGGDLFTSGLVLVTKMKLEVQEEAAEGGVRVNVIDNTTGGFLAEVHVKAIGSADAEFKSGETDLRGVFQTDGLNGTATVVARDGAGRYAFYRGDAVLGSPPVPENGEPKPGEAAAAQQLDRGDYLQNLKMTNDLNQQGNIRTWDAKRRGGQKGVEVQKAY